MAWGGRPCTVSLRCTTVGRETAGRSTVSYCGKEPMEMPLRLILRPGESRSLDDVDISERVLLPLLGDETFELLSCSASEICTSFGKGTGAGVEGRGAGVGALDGRGVIPEIPSPLTNSGSAMLEIAASTAAFQGSSIAPCGNKSETPSDSSFETLSNGLSKRY
jgi:hypothetical protein